MLLSFLLPAWHLEKHLHVHSAYRREGWVLARPFYIALYLKTVMFASLQPVCQTENPTLDVFIGYFVFTIVTPSSCL